MNNSSFGRKMSERERERERKKIYRAIEGENIS
jgi:hypothetical protein